MGPYLLRVRWHLDVVPMGKSHRALALRKHSQSATSQWGWGFHTVRGDNDPGDRRFRPRVDGVVDVCMEVFLIWE